MNESYMNESYLGGGVVAACIGTLLILGCEDAPMPTATAQEKTAASQGSSAFGIDLYKQLSGADGNLFFSPYSISTALAMTYAGACGETEKEMAKVLHAGMDQGRYCQSMAALNADILAAGRASGCDIHTANGLWAQKGHPFRPEYLTMVEKTFGAELAEVDFATSADKVTKEINAWVERQTANKIKDLFARGMLNDQTRLALANAIYFKGKWEHPFSKGRTRPGDFHVSADRKTTAQMMHLTQHFSYAELEDVQVLEMPYTKRALRFVAILPRKIDGLSTVEKKLIPAYLTDCLRKLHSQEVHVTLPRFELHTEFQLNQALAALGMPGAFSPREADFSGMDGAHDLFLSAVVHKAFVDVNEEGTEAAAATGIGVMTAAMPLKKRPSFLADHPFLFLIRDAESGAVLFLGRYVKP
jgi:serine protease inhibitor